MRVRMMRERSSAFQDSAIADNVPVTRAVVTEKSQRSDASAVLLNAFCIGRNLAGGRLAWNRIVDTSPSPELLLHLAALQAEREERGAKWCRKHGIGAQRRILGSPCIVAIAEAKSPEMLKLAEARRSAAELLASTCRACGQCKWAGM